jgi:hypothetical protein
MKQGLHFVRLASRKRGKPKKSNGISGIEKGVPIPPDWVSQFPLADMIVGDSFTIPEHRAASFRTRLSQYRKQFPDQEFTRRVEGERIRVWRIK